MDVLFGYPSVGWMSCLVCPLIGLGWMSCLVASCLVANMNSIADFPVGMAVYDGSYSMDSLLDSTSVARFRN